MFISSNLHQTAKFLITSWGSMRKKVRFLFERFSKCLSMISLFSLKKLAYFGGFEWEIFLNLCLSGKDEKIETSQSEILKMYGMAFCLTFSQKILNFQFYVGRNKKMSCTTLIWQCETFSVKHFVLMVLLLVH